MANRIVAIDGIELATETFGDPSHPALLMIMGAGASMVWWDDGLCRRLADGGRRVIRYDHRDTGRSTCYEPGRPGYRSQDLVADAIAILDAYEISAAHVVGQSMGGALAQLLALQDPDRVVSLVLISTTLAVASERELPAPAPSYLEFLSTVAVDWSDPQSTVEYLVDHWRVLSATERPFEEGRVRELATRDVRRARNFASSQNHSLLGGDEPQLGRVASIDAPTLVIHGSADPLFPLEHGAALSQEIANARLVTLDGAGHGLQSADWETVGRAILAHTDVDGPLSAAGG
jgi:pimeloyl-ACP methyl ester carboxylesterase